MRERLRLERWPIALRVTAVFAVTMALLLTGTGLFVYFGLRAELTGGLDESLETQAAAVARLIGERGEARPGLTEGLDDPGETFTQVIGPGERLLSSTPGLPLRPILDPAERAAAAEGATITLEGIVVEGDDDTDEIDVEALEETGSEAFEEDRARVIARRAEVAGRPLAIIVGATFEDPNEALSRLAAILFIGAPVALLGACAVGYGAVRGALRPVERMRLRAATISASEPGARLPVAPAHDELARLGRTLNDMLARLEGALERERTFVADASHELRTPLAILRAELEVALKEPRSADVMEAAMRSAHEEAERLTGIAEGLLLLARSDTGGLPLLRELVDVRDLLTGTSERFRRRARDLGRALRVEAPAGLHVEGDRRRLDQALSNLVENALGHGAGDVDLMGRTDGDRVELIVHDHGPGFPAELAPRAFTRFSRARDARPGAGTGLGLAIVAAIASAHGGSAHVGGEPGDGARVVLRLPAARR